MVPRQLPQTVIDACTYATELRLMATGDAYLDGYAVARLLGVSMDPDD